MKDVFTLKRLGPRGPDTSHHQFCVAANGNPKLVRAGESGRSALITGARSSDPEACRKTVQRLCSELNAVVARFSNGEFHEEQFAPGTRVMTDQGRPGTVVGHTEYDTALVRFDDADGKWEWPDERLIVQEDIPVRDSADREIQELPGYHNEQAGRKSSEEAIRALNQWWEEDAERLNELGRIFKARGITVDVCGEDDGKGQQLRTEIPMTAAEKAKAGLWLVHEAILDYIAENPEAKGREIRHQLGLDSPNEKGERADVLLWGLMNLLRMQGRVRSDGDQHYLADAEVRKRQEG